MNVKGITLITSFFFNDTATTEIYTSAIVAPMIYRILYCESPPSLATVHQWVERCLP